jgi:hypothetical protein
VPAAGRQRREGAKNEREKEHVVAEVLKRFHQFGEFFFAEISQNDFAALRLCVRLNRISGSTHPANEFLVERSDDLHPATARA